MRAAAGVYAVAILLGACIPGVLTLSGDAGREPIDATRADAILTDGGVAEDSPCGADLATDPRNCGLCGHDCLGGTCAASACVPILVASGQGKPSSIAVNDTGIYWTNGSANSIGYAPIDGGTEGVFVSFAGRAPGGIAVDDGHVYWTRWLDGLVGWVAIDGGAASSFPSLGIGPTTMVAQGGTLALVNDEPFDCQNKYSVVRMAVDGGGAAIVAEAGTQLPSVVLVGQAVYWSSEGVASCDAGNRPGAVEGMPVAGGPVKKFPASQPDALATDGTELFWVDLHGGAVGAASIVGQPLDGGAARVLAANLGLPFAIAVDDSNVYWVDVSSNSVLRIRKDGSQSLPVTVANGQAGIYALAVDARFVYWTSTTAGTVMKVAK